MEENRRKIKEMVFIAKEENSSVLVFHKWREVGWHVSSPKRRDRNYLIHLAAPPYEGATMIMEVMV